MSPIRFWPEAESSVNFTTITLLELPALLNPHSLRFPEMRWSKEGLHDATYMC